MVLSPAKLFKGGLLVALDNWSQQIFQFITILYVGNLIGPAALGQMTFALIYLLFMHALLMNGFTDVVIQRKDMDTEHYDAAFWTISAAGLVAAVASYFIAPFVARVIGEPIVGPLIQALSPAFLAMGITTFLDARIRRDLKFGTIAGRSILSVGLASLAAIVLANRGLGVWSLVVYHLVWRYSEMVFLAIVARYRPRLHFSVNHFSDLLDFGLNSVGIRLVSFLSENIDRLIIGTLLGAAALGIYSIALRFVMSLTDAISGVFQGFAMPLFARLQHDEAGFAKAVTQAMQLASYVAVPAFCGLAFTAPALVAVLFKAEWQGQGLVAVLQILALGSIANAIGYFLDSGLRAYGKAALAFRLSAAMFIVRAILLIAVSHLGLIAIASVNAVLMWASFAVWFVILDRVVKLGRGPVMRAFAPALWSSLAMSLALLALTVFTAGLGALPQLILMIAVGAAIYGGVMLATNPDIAALKTVLLKKPL